MKAYLFGVILFGFLLQCTHSDENTSNGTTQFLIDGKRFEINNAGIVNFGGGANYNGHRTVLLFTTKGISFGKDANKNLVLKGKGALFGVVIYLPNPLQLDEGKYFVNLRPPHKHYDIGVGFYTLDFDENKVTAPYFDYEGIGLLSGSMTVKYIQKGKRIQLSLISEKNVPFEARYEGELSVLSYNLQPDE